MYLGNDLQFEEHIFQPPCFARTASKSAYRHGGLTKTNGNQAINFPAWFIHGWCMIWPVPCLFWGAGQLFVNVGAWDFEDVGLIVWTEDSCQLGFSWFSHELVMNCCNGLGPHTGIVMYCAPQINPNHWLTCHSMSIWTSGSCWHRCCSLDLRKVLRLALCTSLPKHMSQRLRRNE